MRINTTCTSIDCRYRRRISANIDGSLIFFPALLNKYYGNTSRSHNREMAIKVEKKEKKAKSPIAMAAFRMDSNVVKCF